jgi:hypothetical protein
MDVAYHLAGGATFAMKLKLGAAQANAGIIVMGGVTTAVGAIPVTTTSFANANGLSLDRGVYSSTQGDAEGLVTVDVRPDLIIRALMSGGATEGTALTALNSTSASAGGTTVTDADVGSADMDGGTVWCIEGNNVGLSRSITAHTGSTSIVVTVPFPRAIATTDTYVMCPWNKCGTGAAGADGPATVQTTTLFTQADAAIASGTGGEASVVDLILNGRSDSYVLFRLRDHIHGSAALAS